MKNIFLIISLILNAVGIAFFSLAFTSRGASFVYYPGDKRGDNISSAMIVTVPAKSASVTFNPVRMTLHVGDTAALQVSAARDGRQGNILLNLLYDHTIVTIRPTGYGVTITARKAGATTAQIVTENGILDAAIITVIP
jgi:hypothetical protein